MIRRSLKSSGRTDTPRLGSRLGGFRPGRRGALREPGAGGRPRRARHPDRGRGRGHRPDAAAIRTASCSMSPEHVSRPVPSARLRRRHARRRAERSGPPVRPGRRARSSWTWSRWCRTASSARRTPSGCRSAPMQGFLAWIFRVDRALRAALADRRRRHCGAVRRGTSAGIAERRARARRRVRSRASP